MGRQPVLVAPPPARLAAPSTVAQDTAPRLKKGVGLASFAAPTRGFARPPDVATALGVALTPVLGLEGVADRPLLVAVAAAPLAPLGLAG